MYCSGIKQPQKALHEDIIPARTNMVRFKANMSWPFEPATKPEKLWDN
jgi:hypothetical protein